MRLRVNDVSYTVSELPMDEAHHEERKKILDEPIPEER